ncbi:hypothetical protein Hypma_001514 [Hypsizygus marmoreus]|uniref:Uncharacterized protein n=1 Tax=Hypsizygus marmoreus TaxID=39966 RepID=A0A369K6A2_HYPMA|nr:hypothetical protein Hypma_001514 [Hypsizygus marmoreus]
MRVGVSRDAGLCWAGIIPFRLSPFSIETQINHKKTAGDNAGGRSPSRPRTAPPASGSRRRSTGRTLSTRDSGV